jgi:hypothetical protein
VTPLETAFERCPVHPEDPSVATCTRCGRFLCAQCLRNPTPPLCAACFVKWSDPLGILSAPFGIAPALGNGARMVFPVLGRVLLLCLLFAIPSGLLSYATTSTSVGPIQQMRATNMFDFFIGLVCNVACLFLFIGVAEGRPLGLGQAVQEAGAKYGRVLSSYFRSGLWILLLGLLFVLPGIWKAVLIAFSTAAAVRIRRGDPLEFSTALVTGRWWPVFGTLAALVALLYVPGLVLIFALESGAELAELPEQTPLRMGMAVFEDFVLRVVEQLYGAGILAMFYALIRTTDQTLEPMRWRDDKD